MLSLRRIVHPTDFSLASRSGLVLALKLAKQARAELIVIHVLPPAIPIYEVESMERPRAEAELSALIKKIRWAKVKTRRLLVKGNTGVATHIIDCARILKADLIVMGTRERSALSKFFTSSAAAAVIAKASCPVLVVRNRPNKIDAFRRSSSLN